MKKNLLFVFAAFAAVMLLTGCSQTKRVASETSNGSSKRNVIYAYTLDDVMYPEMYTHIVISFLQTDKNGNVYGSSFPHGADKLNSFRAAHPGVKILCALGGASNSEMLGYSIMDDEARANLAKSVSALVRERKLDGIDLDWEYYSDYYICNENYLDLAKRIRKILGSKRLLTMAGQQAVEFFADDNIITMMNKYLDFTSVMTYDFDYEFRENKTIGYNGNFSSLRRLMDMYADVVNKKKLNVGIPYYGVTYRLEESELAYRGDPMVAFRGNSNYPKTVAALGADRAANPDAYDDDDGVALAVKNKMLYVFDNATTVYNKADWACKNGYGGVMEWVASDDEPLGTLQKSVVKALNDNR